MALAHAVGSAAAFRRGTCGRTLSGPSAIDAASDLADLKRSYSTAYAAAKQAGDVAALNDFERAKDARKAALTEAA